MHFNPQVYHDLLRCGDGSAEGLVVAFFDVVRVAPALGLHSSTALSALASAACPCRAHLFSAWGACKQSCSLTDGMTLALDITMQLFLMLP